MTAASPTIALTMEILTETPIMETITETITEIQETAMAILVMVVMDMTMAMVETAVTAI